MTYLEFFSALKLDIFSLGWVTYYLHVYNVQKKEYNMTVREIKIKLINDGWYQVIQHGSHMQFEHGTKSGNVTVPNHNGDIAKGTLNNILKQAGLK